MSTPRKIAFNVIIASISKVLNTIIALIGLMMITSYLGPEKFGLYVIALTFSGLFNAIGDWGLYQTTTRNISRPNAKEDVIIGNVMALRLIVAILMIVVIPVIIYFLPYSTELKSALFIILLNYIFYSFYQILIGLFQKRLIMYQITLVELSGKIIQIIIVAISVYLKLSLQFIVSGIAISMLSNFIIIYFLSRRFIKIKLDFNYRRWLKFLKESWPIGISVIVTFVYFRADSLLLKSLDGDRAVGIYGAAYKILENITFFPGMIIGLMMPMFAHNLVKNKNRFKRLANETFKLFVILIIPLILLIIFFAPNIITIITKGNAFNESAIVLRIIVFALSFIFFGMFFGSILIAGKLQLKQLWALSIAAIFNVTANFIFIPKYSYLAPAIISVVTEGLVVFLSAWIVYKNIKFIPSLKNFPKIIIAGIIMFLYILLLQRLPFLFLLLTSPLIYFTTLISLKIISKKELLLLIKK